jgi:hypothetical protein
MTDQTRPDTFQLGEPTVPLVPTDGYRQPEVPPLEPTSVDLLSGSQYPDFSYDQPSLSQAEETSRIDPNPLPAASNYAQPSVPTAPAYANPYERNQQTFSAPAPRQDPFQLEAPTNQVVQYQQYPPPAATPLQEPIAYDYGYARPAYFAPEHPNAVLSLVLGLAGLFVVPIILSPIAWVLAARGRRDIAAYPGRWANGGALTAGFVLGIIGTIIAALILSFYGLFFALMIASGV